MTMRIPGLAGWLAIGTTAFVGATVAAVAATGVGLLRDLAEREALTRVGLAVAAAREDVRRDGEELSIAARVLGERPTLRRLLETPDADALAPYLRRYCDGARLDACAVIRDDAVLAATVRAPPWPPLVRAAAEQGERFVVALGAGDAPAARGAGVAVGASASVVGRDASVLVTRWLDAAFVAGLAERAGLDVELAGLDASGGGAAATAALDTDALARGLPAADRVPALGADAASLPLAAPTG